MEQPLPKAVLIAELSASRAELESVVSQVPLERMTEDRVRASDESRTSPLIYASDVLTRQRTV